MEKRAGNVQPLLLPKYRKNMLSVDEYRTVTDAEKTHETKVHSSLKASIARRFAQWLTTRTYCMAISSQGDSILPS